MNISISNKLPTEHHKEVFNKVVNVAVAVIHYEEQYLLGYRNHEQHQGNRYEFVGGKIDAEETAVTALIRETVEETGIDISENIMVKLGRLHHDYGDKYVCLQVYKVTLNAEQYQYYRALDRGLEGQALTWVDKQALLNNQYTLPAANQTILTWLRLAKSITITYPLSHFIQDQEQSAEQNQNHETFKQLELTQVSTRRWLRFHHQRIANDAWCYLRLKVAVSENETNDEMSIAREGNIAGQLLEHRGDINAIIPYKLRHLDTAKNLTDSQDNRRDLGEHHSKITAYHLTQMELMTWYQEYQQDKGLDLLQRDDYADTGLIVSCHDVSSIVAANELARLRLVHSLAPVIAIFVSPVLVTKTHPNEVPLGWEQWSKLVALADMPVIALGGLAPNMEALANRYGGSCIAGIRGFLKQ